MYVNRKRILKYQLFNSIAEDFDLITISDSLHKLYCVTTKRYYYITQRAISPPFFFKTPSSSPGHLLSLFFLFRSLYICVQTSSLGPLPGHNGQKSAGEQLDVRLGVASISCPGVDGRRFEVLAPGSNRSEALLKWSRHGSQ